jgi:membrane protease YdiL (CAAX protease family)/flagellar basal body-associated protein FliL
VSEISAPIGSGARFERLGAKDLRVLIVWILLGALGVFVAWHYYFQAFPEASINFTVSRDEALNRAKRFLTQQGASLNGYESTIVFSVDDNVKTYLERTVGLEQANKLMATEVNAWHWEIRFFRPQQKEEFRADVNPEGRIVGYEHIVEEARAGASLERDAAQKLAENYLRGQYGADLARYDFLPEESNPTERPNRRDWSFTWQLRGFRAPDNSDGAPYRLKVSVQGDQVGGATEFLKIPEAWQRDFQRMRSRNDLIEDIAIIPYMLLLSAAFWFIFELSRRGGMRWSSPLWIGIFFALLWFFMSVCNWPVIRAEYDTNSSYSAFALGQIAYAALLSIIQALLVTIAVAPGEPLYRVSQPSRMQLFKAWKLPGLRSKEFFTAGIIGVSLAAIHIGYVVVFYLVGRQHGVWAPQDLNFDDSTSSIFPWLGALSVGMYAAASEEFLFRLFAIPFFHRVTKSKVIAVILPAFMWSFLHANYPQEPAYIRGIEIGLIGIVAGLVMLRWGILATLVWHYTVDATLGSLLLLRSASPYLRISGALVAGAAFLPLIYCGVMYLKRGGFEVREDLLNSAEPLPKPQEQESSTKIETVADTIANAYQSIPRRYVVALVLCGVAGIAIIASTHLQKVGDYAHTSMNARQAAAAANDVMQKQNVNLAKYHRATIFLSNLDSEASDFLVSKVGVEKTNQIYQQQIPEVFWRVRYFRDSDAEEFVVLFKANGEFHSFWHTLDERTVGAKLSKDDAIKLAQDWIRANKQIDFSAWRLVDSKSENPPNRVDHTFIWEQITPLAGGPKAGDAAFKRMEIHVRGDQVSEYRTYVKLPEQWVLDADHENVLNVLQKVWPYLFFLGVAVFALVGYLRNLKLPSATSIPWRKLIWCGIVACLAFITSAACNWPATLHAYKTEIPFNAFVATIAIGWLIAGGIALTGVTFLFGLGWFFWTRAGNADKVPGWMNRPRNYYRDALVFTLAGGAAWIGFEHLVSFLTQKLAGASAEAVTFPQFDSLSPAAQSIAGTLLAAFATSAIISALGGFVAVYVRSRMLQTLLLIGLTLADMGSAETGLAFVVTFLFTFLKLYIVWWVILKIIRHNLLGLFLLVAAISLLDAGTSLVAQPNTYLRNNGVIVLGVLALLLLWPLAAWLRGPGDAASVPVVTS